MLYFCSLKKKRILNTTKISVLRILKARVLQLDACMYILLFATVMTESVCSAYSILFLSLSKKKQDGILACQDWRIQI